METSKFATKTPPHYNLYTLCRSGNHAVIAWILRNVSRAQFQKLRGQTGLFAFCNREEGIFFRNNMNHCQRDLNGFRLPPKDKIQFQLDSWEDCIIPVADGVPRIVVIREFGNLLASRFKKYYGPRDSKGCLGLPKQRYLHTIQELITTWKNHARAVASGNVVGVLYDKWVVDKEYRDGVMERLGGRTNTKDDRTLVADFGGGSSFVGSRRENDASSYLRRWERVKLPQEMVRVALADQELIDLNRQLFGTDLGDELKF
jgi:hypothetical protein